MLLVSPREASFSVASHHSIRTLPGREGSQSFFPKERGRELLSGVPETAAHSPASMTETTALDRQFLHHDLYPQMFHDISVFFFGGAQSNKNQIRPTILPFLSVILADRHLLWSVNFIFFYYFTSYEYCFRQ